jgi:hypothetical protein
MTSAMPATARALLFMALHVCTGFIASARNACLLIDINRGREGMDNEKMREAFATLCKECGPTISYYDFEMGWQSAQSEQSVPVVGDVVAYGVPNSRPTESSPLMHVMLQIPAGAQYPELLVPLIVQPTTSITTAELERLRKDEELKASEASIACEALQEIIDLLPGSSVAQAKLIAVAAMTKRAAIAAEGEKE